MHLECVLLVGTGSARKASWPAAHVRAATKAEHMAAPTSELQRSQKPLPTESRPHTATLSRLAAQRPCRTVVAVDEFVGSGRSFIRAGMFARWKGTPRYDPHGHRARPLS